jgi:hypothetical protein
VLICVIFALGQRFFQFISTYSVNVFFDDQWDFLSLFFRGSPTLAQLFFLQHGPHREGVGLIADKFLYSWTRWSVRAETWMIGSCIFAAMLVAVLVKRKLFGRLSYTDSAIPLIFLTLVQHDTLIVTPNPAYSGFPLLFILLYCLALTQDKYLVRYGLVLLINFPLIYTGLGVFMGPVTIGVFAVELYWSARRMSSVPLAAPVGALVLAGASFGSFFIHYTFVPAVDCFEFPHRDLMSYPWFMALMSSAFLGLRVPVWLATAAGSVILFCGAAACAAQVRRLAGGVPPGDALVSAVLIGYSLLYAASTAVGRVCLGLPETAQSSRYATLLIPAFLGLYYYLLSLSSGTLRRAALALFVMAVIPGCLRVPWYFHLFVDQKRAWAACYVQTESIASCDQATHFRIHPDPQRAGLQEKLDYLKQRRLNLFADAAK